MKYDWSEVEDFWVLNEERVRDLAERTTEFSLRIIKLAGALLKTNVARIIENQVVRSGTSIGANYREARRSRSRAEFIAKIGDCLKEADETAYWLELLERSGHFASDKMSYLRDETNQLVAIFTAIHKSTKENRKP